jgi:hypothetical protein
MKKALLFGLAIMILIPAFVYSQSQDRDLNDQETIAAQNQMAGTWNLAFCGEPLQPEHKGVPHWYNLTVTADTIENGSEGFTDVTTKTITGVGSNGGEKTDTEVGEPYKFLGGSLQTNNGRWTTSLLTFVSLFTVDGRQYAHMLSLEITPNGRIFGLYVPKADPQAEPSVNFKYDFVFGQRGNADTLESFSSTAAQICSDVYADPNASDNQKGEPIRVWTGVR